MFFAESSLNRRRFVRLTLAMSTGALLSGCGGSGTAADVPTTAAAATLMPATTPLAVGNPLNLALNLSYLGANYYSFAARGVGLAANLTGGMGVIGVATGARQASFTDPLIAAHAAELADDKATHVQSLRNRLGGASAAQPAIDLSTGTTSAFALATRNAGIVASGSAFDPYAGDGVFLIGAFLIENIVAAAYRTLLTQSDDAATTALVMTHLADAIYHGGLIRALLADKASTDASVDQALTQLSALLAQVDGSNVGDQTLANASGLSSNIPDAGGRPIPFTRAPTQVLKALYLSGTAVGGFLPEGANGVG